MLSLTEQFGAIDIYLFDQLMKGRIRLDWPVLDAGCGGGRNLVYLLREGFDVHAIDHDPDSVASVQHLASILAPKLPLANFRTASIESIPFIDAYFGTVISNTVLHFAHDDAHFQTMLHEMWRVLSRGGLFFARLASNIGMESRVVPLGGRRFTMLDGSDRYLVDEALLMDLTRSLGAELLDPIKTTLVQDQRCMTTWVLRKH